MLPIPVPPDFRIIAHRGASAYAPENTKPEADLEIARNLLLNRYLYQRTLVDGLPAIANRQIPALTN